MRLWVLGGLAVLAGVVRAQLPPGLTVKSMHVPPGFSVSVFAAEPDVRQPISFAIDDRGRLWVAENYSYPKWSLTGHDRIVVFEDADGDGHFDRRTVFYDKLNYVTGVEVGFGGAWVVSAPYLLFIPDRDNDLKPDREPQVLLEGFGHEGVHNLVNGCAWGPDGWLYGGHGGSSYSVLGPPSSPEKQRIHFDGGVWRYHPTKHVFEGVMEGTTNPWGIDWDDYGQTFISNSVTPHLYHVIPGSHVERRRVSPLSTYAFGRIDTIADHLHWVGADWTKSRGGTEQQAAVGGGHAHCGLMVYLGESFPSEYRGRIFMNNIHGDRMNNDLPEHKGSGYVAHHGKDFLVCDDHWYQGLLMKYGPDGGVYAADWYDTGECHTRTPDARNGRIYKITYKGTTPVTGLDVATMREDELVKWQLSRNEWFVRHARRVLQERGCGDRGQATLRDVLRDNPDVTRKLRATWALWAVGGLSEDDLLKLLSSTEPYLRGWAVQLLAEGRQVSPRALARIEQLAATDGSPVVRLFIASALQRIAPAERWTAIQHLLSHAEDETDQNLPQMYWYAMEPLAAGDPPRALAVATRGKISRVRQWTARRVAMK